MLSAIRRCPRYLEGKVCGGKTSAIFGSVGQERFTVVIIGTYHTILYTHIYCNTI